MSARRWLLRGLFLLSGAWLVLEGAAWAVLRTQAAMRVATPAELEELNRLLGLPPGSHLLR